MIKYLFAFLHDCIWICFAKILLVLFLHSNAYHARESTICSLPVLPVCVSVCLCVFALPSSSLSLLAKKKQEKQTKNKTGHASCANRAHRAVSTCAHAQFRCTFPNKALFYNILQTFKTLTLLLLFLLRS